MDDAFELWRSIWLDCAVRVEPHRVQSRTECDNVHREYFCSSVLIPTCS